MTQLDDMDFIAVRIQHERRDPNSPLQRLAGSYNSPNQWLFQLKKPLVRWKAQSGGTSSIFNCHYSVFFWHLYWKSYTVRVRESPSSNLGTPPGVHIVSHLGLAVWT